MRNHRKKGGTKEKKNEVEEKPTVLIQPKRSYAEYDNITFAEETKDFESLTNASTSAGGQFAFKSEKNWADDVSGCFEYFTLDLQLLNAAINCIPFNECIEIENEYFTDDQLTKLHNAAEEEKEVYKKLLQASKISDQQKAKESKESVITQSLKIIEKSTNFAENTVDFNSFIQQSEGKDEDDNPEDDLDFLLSLDSPATQSIRKQTISKHLPYKNVSASKVQTNTAPTKSMDLETWLDSILED